MRAPFQILAIPYRLTANEPLFCVLYRSDCDYWQFIAGGGEDKDTPLEAAKREILEEGGVNAEGIIQLKSMCFLPTEEFPNRHLYGWPDDTYVVPEYSFAFECPEDITLSCEHTELKWLVYEQAREVLKWDSNRTALYEIKCRLEACNGNILRNGTVYDK